MAEESRNLNDIIADRIKFLMKSRGFTYDSIAEATEVGKTTVYMRLRENRFPLDWLEKLAQVMNVPLSAFFGEDDGNEVGKVRELEKEVEQLHERIALLQELNENKDRTIRLLEEKLEGYEAEG